MSRLPESTVSGKFPYSFVNNNSKKLVVTIGDSWTWGADLSFNDDLAIRNKDVYGAIIARELSADFLNLGQCGSCNLHIIERIKELHRLIPTLDYQEILIICTYTEVGRSFNSSYDSTVDYYKWFSSQTFNKIDDFNLILEYHNGLFQTAISDLAQTYPHVQIVAGNNFTDPIGTGSLPKTWLQLITEELLEEEYTQPCYIMSHWVLDTLPTIITEFAPTINQTMLKEWMILLLDSANQRKILTNNSQYFAGVNHPRQLGHNLWAHYLLDNFL